MELFQHLELQDGLQLQDTLLQINGDPICQMDKLLATFNNMRDLISQQFMELDIWLLNGKDLKLTI